MQTLRFYSVATTFRPIPRGLKRRIKKAKIYGSKNSEKNSEKNSGKNGLKIKTYILL